MNVLQDALLKSLESQLPRLMTDLIIEKIEVHGIRVSARKRKAIETMVATERNKGIRFQEWKWWERTKEIVIEFNEEDIARFQLNVSTLTKRLPDLIGPISDDLADMLLAEKKPLWRSYARKYEKYLRSFRDGLDARWQEPLDRLAMILTIAREFSETVGTQLQKTQTEQNQYLVGVMVRLHARACQVADEIVTLLRSGFADGAMARWRCLHEIAVTAILISERGNECAERYLLYNAVESYKAAVLYQEHAARLGYEPFSEADITEMRNAYEAVRRRYGNIFTRPYGWASENPDDHVNGFADVEKKVNLSHLRPYYKLASHNVHANPKGVLHKLGVLPGHDLLLTGPSNYGFADPGQNTALSLVHVSSAFGLLEPTLDNIVTTKTLLILLDKTCEGFVSIQKQIEAEEALL